MSIETISATNLRNKLGNKLKSLRKDDILIITRRGKGEKAVVDLKLLKGLLDDKQRKELDSNRNQNELDEWTRQFIDEYRPALENLSKR